MLQARVACIAALLLRLLPFSVAQIPSALTPIPGLILPINIPTAKPFNALVAKTAPKPQSAPEIAPVVSNWRAGPKQKNSTVEVAPQCCTSYLSSGCKVNTATCGLKDSDQSRMALTYNVAISRWNSFNQICGNKKCVDMDTAPFATSSYVNVPAMRILKITKRTVFESAGGVIGPNSLLSISNAALVGWNRSSVTASTGWISTANGAAFYLGESDFSVTGSYLVLGDRGNMFLNNARYNLLDSYFHWKFGKMSFVQSSFTIQASTTVGATPRAWYSLRSVNLINVGSTITLVNITDAYIINSQLNFTQATLQLVNSNLRIYNSRLFINNTNIVLSNSRLFLGNTTVTGDQYVTSFAGGFSVPSLVGKSVTGAARKLSLVGPDATFVTKSTPK